jgi:parallel beta-helix repeat protein
MKRTALALTLILALLFSAVAGTELVNFISAQDFEAVTIKADGSIDPSTAPIQRNGDVYTLVGDIDDYVLLERNNTIFDGAGHAVGGIYGPLPVQVGYEWQVNATTNIKIVNAVINGDGIFFLASYNSTFANNTLNNGRGFDCTGDGNVIANNTVNSGRGIASSGKGNTISGNHLTNCNYTFVQNNPSPYGIIVGGSNNTLVGNYIVGTNGTGINLGTSSKNTIIGNHLTDNKVGISAANIYPEGSALDNIIYYNNFINNTKNVYNELIGPFATIAVNIWDNGTVGNYWSDYNGTDGNNDGIGDTPYVIDASNQDRYPLMNPVDIDSVTVELPEWASPPSVRLISPKNTTYTSANVTLEFTINKQTSWMGYSLDGQDNVTITGNTTLTGLSSGLHNITVYAKDEFENMGNSETTYFSVEVPFPTTLVVASTVSVAVVGVGLLVYFKKRRH